MHYSKKSPNKRLHSYAIFISKIEQKISKTY